MPLLTVSTNQSLTDEARSEFLRRASKQLAQWLGKSENYVMIHLATEQALVFGGDSQPAAWVGCASLGLREDQTVQLSERLCAFLADQLDLDQARIYIHFQSPERAFWGWNGRTFA